MAQNLFEVYFEFGRGPTCNEVEEEGVYDLHSSPPPGGDKCNLASLLGSFLVAHLSYTEMRQYPFVNCWVYSLFTYFVSYTPVL